MVDTLILLIVARLGYSFSSDDDNMYWFMKDGRKTGPFKNLDDAAYEALAESEINEAYSFWRGPDKTEEEALWNL